jgi:hypothetical protein
MGDLVVDPTKIFNLFPCLACAHNVASLGGGRHQVKERKEQIIIVMVVISEISFFRNTCLGA